jgi:GT2 family glycosyltransferase
MQPTGASRPQPGRSDAYRAVARVGRSLTRTSEPPDEGADPAGRRPGVVTVVVLNFRGADDTITCLRSLETLDWPADRLEVICVDNASGDGSAERIREAVPGVRLIESTTNTGFAGGINLGFAAAAGEYVATINNDARPHPQWVRAAVAELEADPGVACVASKVLDWDGTSIDYVDGSLTWFGMGYKREVERPDSPDYDSPKDVLFATGAAMVARAAVFSEVGGFDERFFMFYEDVDLGWRLNLLGWRVRYVPGSIAYHKHHQSMKTYGLFREHYLLERNALMAMYKNYGNEALARAFPAALALSVRRSLSRGNDDPSALDLQRSPGDESQRIEVDKETLVAPYAIDYFVDHLPALDADRQWLQSHRRRSDVDLVPLFRQAMEPAYADPRYLTAHQSLVDAFGIEDLFARRRRIVIVTGEPLGAKMAGPAIRAWEIAKALAPEHDVQLVSTGSCSLDSPDFTVRSASGRDLRKLEAWCDVLIFQGLLLSIHPWLQRSRKVLVADIYDPFHLEVLEQLRDSSDAHRAQTQKDTVDALNVQLTRGDFFLCASPKQRDFWLGQLAGLGRINPHTYDEDENLDSLISVVPFGLDEAPPVRNRPAIKGVVPGIGVDDKVIMWGGGVYNWFDPLTLISAMDRLRERRPDAKLFFLGMRHPNPDVPEMVMAAQARALSARLGLTDTHVFFNADWVAYEDRANYLLDSDIGVSCHLQHVETAFSFRTRILDYLWAGLPVVSTRGDELGDRVGREGLGAAVAPGDPRAFAAACSELLADPEPARARVRAVAAELTWDRVVAPLRAFCETGAKRAPSPLRQRALRRATLAQYPQIAAETLSVDGPGFLARKLGRNLARAARRA